VLKEQRGVLMIVLMLSLTVCAGGCSKAAETPLPETPPTSIPTPAPTSALTSSGVDPFEQNVRLGRGVNLGNALEAPREGEWGVTLKEEYFQLIQDAGFDAVRIPIRWSAHADSAAPYTIEPSFFERVDWAVNQALSRDLLVVLNVHHYEEIMLRPKEHRERFLALWAQIADHYKAYPADLLFEVLNEPNGALTAGAWNSLLKEALQAIRQTNPERNVVVGPANWNSIDGLGSLEFPEDAHVIVTVHYYLPFQFTHQGAEWADGSDAWLGTTWQGTSSETQAVTRDLDRAAAWGKANHRALYVGEFGAYSKADMDSRARWTDFVARQAEERGMSWAYWEFCAGFGVYDPSAHAWNRPILEALLPPAQ